MAYDVSKLISKRHKEQDIIGENIQDNYNFELMEDSEYYPEDVIRFYGDVRRIDDAENGDYALKLEYNTNNNEGVLCYVEEDDYIDTNETYRVGITARGSGTLKVAIQCEINDQEVFYMFSGDYAGGFRDDADIQDAEVWFDVPITGTYAEYEIIESVFMTYDNVKFIMMSDENDVDVDSFSFINISTEKNYLDNNNLDNWLEVSVPKEFDFRIINPEDDFCSELLEGEEENNEIAIRAIAIYSDHEEDAGKTYVARITAKNESGNGVYSGVTISNRQKLNGDFWNWLNGEFDYNGSLDMPNIFPLELTEEFQTIDTLPFMVDSSDEFSFGVLHMDDDDPKVIIKSIEILEIEKGKELTVFEFNAENTEAKDLAQGDKIFEFKAKDKSFLSLDNMNMFDTSAEWLGFKKDLLLKKDYKNPNSAVSGMNSIVCLNPNQEPIDATQVGEYEVADLGNSEYAFIPTKIVSIGISSNNANYNANISIGDNEDFYNNIYSPMKTPNQNMYNSDFVTNYGEQKQIISGKIKLKVNNNDTGEKYKVLYYVFGFYIPKDIIGD